MSKKHIVMEGAPVGFPSHCVVTEPSAEQAKRGYEFSSIVCGCYKAEDAEKIAKALNNAESRNMFVNISVTGIDTFKALVNALADNADQLPEAVVNELNKILAEEQ
ncbi:hypothetical protein vBVpP1_51 [Vibrio phage vB_VpP_1]|nr:hypothetical protein vBVpP1_51 [Vibrio phage vB_VpP_1]